MIETDLLSKIFYVHRKDPGLWGSLRALVRRERLAKEAVREVSMVVEEGEIVGLVGANGAGKTTLVKMLSGIIFPTSGDARVLGYRPWERDDSLRRQISLIMGQKAQLWWDLPAADCFLLLKEIYGIPEARYRERIDTLASLLQVSGELHVQIRRLSLGERMKMELIAALLHTPRVVYLDEPTIGLDLTAQRSIRRFILEYRREHRPAMIVTSHYMEDIESLCERIVILKRGRVAFDGLLSEAAETLGGHKVLSVALAGDRPQPRPADLATFGRLLEGPAGRLRLEVTREQVEPAHRALEAMLPGVRIQEEDEPVPDLITRFLESPEEGEVS